MQIANSLQRAARFLNFEPERDTGRRGLETKPLSDFTE
jgi:hypothetical protein